MEKMNLAIPAIVLGGYIGYKLSNKSITGFLVGSITVFGLLMYNDLKNAGKIGDSPFNEETHDTEYEILDEDNKTADCGCQQKTTDFKDY